MSWPPSLRARAAAPADGDARSDYQNRRYDRCRAHPSPPSPLVRLGRGQPAAQPFGQAHAVGPPGGQQRGRHGRSHDAREDRRLP